MNPKQNPYPTAKTFLAVKTGTPILGYLELLFQQKCNLNHWLINFLQKLITMYGNL